MATKKAPAKKAVAKTGAKSPAKKAPKAAKKTVKVAPAAVSTPKITEKAKKAPVKKEAKKPEVSSDMDACHVTGKCTGMGHCTCCKWVAFLYILLAVFLAITLTKHMFYYSMYKGGNGKDGRCMYQKQEQMPTAPSAAIEPDVPTSPATPEAPGLPETPTVQ